jgi:hypothetical protein
MGTSLAMIDLHYGHLASDGRQHAVALLDALAREKAVDAGWTPPSPPTKPAQQHAWRRATQGALTLAWTLGGRRAQNATRESSRKEALRMEEAKPVGCKNSVREWNRPVYRQIEFTHPTGSRSRLMSGYS